MAKARSILAWNLMSDNGHKPLREVNERLLQLEVKVNKQQKIIAGLLQQMIERQAEIKLLIDTLPAETSQRIRAALEAKRNQKSEGVDEN